MANLPRVGIDIGSASIKVVELVQAGKKWKLLTAASTPAPVVSGGMVENGGITAFAQVLTRVLKEAGVRSRKAIVAIPEEQVSSHVVEMPLMPDNEVEQALEWQVDQYIPIPKEQAIWSWDIISRNEVGGGMEVLLVAAPKKLVEAYRAVVEQSGLEVVAVETELSATARAVVPANSPLSIIVDIGAKSTDIGVVRGNALVIARTVPTAGEAFTRAIEAGLGLERTQAEQYKMTYGFTEGHLDGKLVEAMKPVLAIIAGEVRKTADFYTSKHAGEVTKTVTLSGGIAALPDVVGMLSGLLGLEVVVGDPFGQVVLDEAQTKAVAGNGPFYAVAVGLGMREI